MKVKWLHASPMIIFASIVAVVFGVSAEEKDFTTGDAAAKPADQSAWRSECADASCGADSLYFLCMCYGFPISHEDLVFMLSPDDLGVSMRSIKEVAEQIGFSAHVYEVTIRNALDPRFRAC